MSPDARNLLIVIGVGAAIGFAVVPEQRDSPSPMLAQPSALVLSQPPAPSLDQPSQLATQASAIQRSTTADLLAEAMANGASYAELAAINGGGALPDAAYSHSIHHRSAFNEGVAATVPTRTVPVYGDPSPRRVSPSYAGVAPLQPQGEHARLSNSNAFGTVLNRSGSSNQYFDQNGDGYTQAGPHGVVNNRTGGFSPTN